MNWIVLISIPLISAFIGWGTNWIAVKMIFRPRKPIRFLFFNIQGLIPKRRHEIAVKIGEVVEKELISHKDIAEILKSPETEKKVKASLICKLDEIIPVLVGKLGPLAAFVSGLDDILSQLKEMLAGMIIKMLPSFIDDVLSRMEEEVSFKEIVIEKIERFELMKLEELILTIAKTELKHIEYLGGMIGFIIGLLQIIIVKFVTLY